jgi:hypothetical protein
MSAGMNVVTAVTWVMVLATWAQFDVQRTEAGSWQTVSVIDLVRSGIGP